MARGGAPITREPSYWEVNRTKLRVLAKLWPFWLVLQKKGVQTQLWKLLEFCIDYERTVGAVGNLVLCALEPQRQQRRQP
jgi:hypothetical protein